MIAAVKEKSALHFQSRTRERSLSREKHSSRELPAQRLPRQRNELCFIDDAGHVVGYDTRGSRFPSVFRLTIDLQLFEYAAKQCQL
ncbi:MULTISPECIES: hypothetical protein [unclassified Mesorhizobium]|uniref:hypothetical protein n=1 Tax=unclassified Mesorhizobium TaxID=325217 RepID=UPI003339D30B